MIKRAIARLIPFQFRVPLAESDRRRDRLAGTSRHAGRDSQARINRYDDEQSRAANMSRAKESRKSEIFNKQLEDWSTAKEEIDL